MEVFAKGEIVILPFPFSDLQGAKIRPALVVATLEGDDLILCQITSKERRDTYSLPVSREDIDGNLPYTSNIRPNKLFTADRSIIRESIGTLKKSKMREIEERIIEIIRK